MLYDLPLIISHARCALVPRMHSIFRLALTPAPRRRLVELIPKKGTALDYGVTTWGTKALRGRPQILFDWKGTSMEYPQATVATSTTGSSHCATDHAVNNNQALAWIEKGHRCSLPLLGFADQVADPAQVVPRVAESVAGCLYGNFMLTWLDSSEDPRVVHYLPDASFFMELLQLSYEPVFRRRPELSRLLDGMSRPQMSLTNDVLQIQLRGLETNYSMVRHHALMLFYSALWLDEPEKSQWMELYDELASQVFEREGGPPSLEELSSAETGAFEDFVTLADSTLTVEAAEILLQTPAKLQRILDYLLYAGAAIGLLWRDYRDVPEELKEGWHRRQLTEGYLRADYLEKRWVDSV